MRRVSMGTRDELLAAISERYKSSTRARNRSSSTSSRLQRDIIASTQCAFFAVGHRASDHQDPLGASTVPLSARR